MKTILAVDDDISILETIDFLLTSDGYNVMLASNGEAALELIKEHWVDIIILDLRMPIVSGYLFANIFLEYTMNKDIKLMVLSGESLVYGNCEVNIPNISVKINKPFDPTDFKKEIVKLAK